MKQKYFRCLIAWILCALTFSCLEVQAQSSWRHKKRSVPVSKAPRQKVTANKTLSYRYVKPRLQTLSSESMKPVELLERTESDNQKTLYEWNDYGHLTAVLFYNKASNGEWTLDQGTDMDYSRRYTYDYKSDHTCSRQSVYSVDDNAVANIEIERIVASTNAEGIYLEQYYKYDKDAAKLLLFEEYGYDRFGNQVIYRKYDDNGIVESGYYRLFSQNVTDEYGTLIDNYYVYMTMELDYCGYDDQLGHESIYGYKRDLTETSNSWTYTSYNWSNESQQFEVEYIHEYVWNDSHDRIVRHREVTETDEYITTMTYDALKRLVKKECSKTGGFMTTSTYTYASQVVFDPRNPVYVTYDSGFGGTIPDDIHLAMQAVEYASRSTFGPVAQFTDYHDEEEDEYTVGTATFEDSRYKHLSFVEYDTYEGSIVEEKGEMDFFHHADGRPDYYVAVFTWNEDGKTGVSHEKYEWNYTADKRSIGHTWYAWNEQTESWSIDEIEIHEYDDAGNCLQSGYKYVIDDDKNGDANINVIWYGHLTVYHYNASGNCTGSDNYVANSATGEWELETISSSDNPYEKSYEENGFRVTEYHYPNDTPRKDCFLIQPSRVPFGPIDFLAGYKSLAFDEDQYEVSRSSEYYESYVMQDDKWVLQNACGQKVSWTDNKTCVYGSYFYNGEQILLVSKKIYEVDDLNRITHAQYQDIDPSGSVYDGSVKTYTYTYLDDTRYLTEMVFLASGNHTSTTKYYYATHQVIDDIASPIDLSSPLFTCEDRCVKSSSPMTVYSLTGQCIAKDTKQLTLSQSGIYLIKIGSSTQKVYIK